MTSAVLVVIDTADASILFSVTEAVADVLVETNEKLPAEESPSVIVALLSVMDTLPPVLAER